MNAAKNTRVPDLKLMLDPCFVPDAPASMVALVGPVTVLSIARRIAAKTITVATA